MLDPVSGEISEIAEDLALKHLRCDPGEPLPFVDPETVERLRYQAVCAWRANPRLPAEAKEQHVCSCVLMSQEAPGRLVGGS